MSAVAQANKTTLMRQGFREPNPYRCFVGVVLATDLLALVIAFSMTRVDLEGSIVDVVAWGGLIACASLIPVQSGRGAWLSLDLPLLLAVGFVFGPVVGGVVGLFAGIDRRELRREISPSRAVFNRAQVSLSTMAGAIVYAGLGGHAGRWPVAALAGLAGLVADCVVNYTLVALSTSITAGRPFLIVVREMRLGSARTFVPAYIAFGFLAVLITEAYNSLGIAGVFASIAPVLLARQAFESRHELDTALELLRIREHALAELDSRIIAERRDERMVLAGELHDEVLPPLFKVHLMGQVLKQDLGAGRLLDLDEDLPHLLEATEAAQSAIRDLLGDLRKSPLGAGGLIPTLRLLVDQLEGLGSPRILLDVSAFEASEHTQLLTYQVAREALSNASKYSRASAIQLRLWMENDLVRLMVQDDGGGFDVHQVDRESHFGLQLIAERVAAVGGHVVIESKNGSGTLIVAALPANL